MLTNETLSVIKQRRSIRSYKKEQIRDEELNAVLEAGLHAPNAGGQAWHFTVVQNKEIMRRINNAAKEALRSYPVEDLKALGEDEKYDGLYGAPTLIIISGRKEYVPLEFDCAAAAQNMLIAAESIGLGACWVYFPIFGFNSPQGDGLNKEIKLPKGFNPYCSVLLGYKDGTETVVTEIKPDLITFIK